MSRDFQRAAIQRATEKGLVPHHFTLTPKDAETFGALLDMKIGRHARQYVLWAYDAKGHRLVPFPL